MAYAGEDHGDAKAVGGGDDFGVADRASGLDDGGGAGLGDGFEAVGERKEGVGGGDVPARGRTAFMAPKRAASTRDIWPAPMPTVWPWPSAEAGVDDGVRFDVLADAPGEEERAESLRRWAGAR